MHIPLTRRSAITNPTRSKFISIIAVIPMTQKTITNISSLQNCFLKNEIVSSSSEILLVN